MATTEAVTMVAFLHSLLLRLLSYLQKAWRRLLGPRWVPVGMLQAIKVYPLKSAAAVSIESADCHHLGIQHGGLFDRMFVAFEEETEAVVTSRTSHRLLGTRVVDCSCGNILKYKFTSTSGREPLIIDLTDAHDANRSVMMKFPTTTAEKLATVDCGDTAADWLSAELNRPGVRLGYWPAGFQRDICTPRSRELGVFKGVSNAIAGAYSNMSSYLLLNLSSVDDLVSRLPPTTTVGPDNFRGNIIVSGASPYAEDTWKTLKIGEAVFKIVKPCVRCILVTIDPNTCEKDPDLEPLKTLKTYRQLKDPKQRTIEGDSPVMGCYMGLCKPGKITLGDTVYALTTPQEKFYQLLTYIREWMKRFTNQYIKF